MRYFYKRDESGLSLVESTTTPQGYVEISKQEYEALYEQSLQSDIYMLGQVSTAKALFKQYRGTAFNAFDIYKTNIQYGIVLESDEQHDEVTDWYYAMLDFPDNITMQSIRTLKFPAIPEVLLPYVQGGVVYEPYTD